MSETECVSCGKSKATLTCEVCSSTTCKKCVQQINADTFSLEKIPAELSHTTYCSFCYDETVAPALAEYEATMEKAKKVFVFFTTQRKEIPLIRRGKEVYTVKDKMDRDETILRLAFFAAQNDYNAITEVVVDYEKLRNGAYQTSRWNGTAQPALIHADRMDIQDLKNLMYR